MGHAYGVRQDFAYTHYGLKRDFVMILYTLFFSDGVRHTTHYLDAQRRLRLHNDEISIWEVQK